MADFQVELEVEDLWKGIGGISKTLTEIHASCESEKEDLWKAIMILEKNFLAFKEEVADRLVLLHKVLDKK